MLNNDVNGTIPSYSFNFSYLDIVNLGDVHYGNSACNKDYFKEVVKYIKDNEDVYWLSTGDILDVNISKSKFYDPSGLEVNEEFEEIVDLLTPIRSKCLGFVGSNHSDRIHKLSGLNLDQITAKVLNIPYLGGMGILKCILANDNGPIKYSYYIAMTHGKSNATTIGSKANSMFRLSEMFNSLDVYLEGHTHTYMTSFKDVNIIDKKTNKIKPHTVTMCVCGHCLEWSKSYAAENKYVPTPIGFPEISLTGDRKLVKVNLLTPNDFKG